ncbi:tyrosine-type recombinase/integrase [Sulfurimonas sp.]
MGYAGITTKTSKSGVNNIFARFKHNGKIYPVKNFTKLFGCNTEKQAFDKLQEVKILISQGHDPFITSPTSLNDIFEDWKARMIRKGEWTGFTPSSYTYFYNAYIRNKIGHKKPSKITYRDLTLVQEQVEHLSSSSKNLLKMVLRPIFNEQIKLGNINKNVILELKTYKEGTRESLELRVNEDLTTTIKKLYNTVELYEPTKHSQKHELKFFLYFAILTGTRYGEILKYKKENCYMEKKLILVPSTITKTDEDYKVPIPDECYLYFDSIEKGLLFPNINRGGVYAMFKKFVNLANVELFEGKVISMHDLRKFLLTIMIRDCKIDSVLADTCLNHKIQGVKKHYINFSYQDKIEAYQKYWDYIRVRQENV